MTDRAPAYKSNKVKIHGTHSAALYYARGRITIVAVVYTFCFVLILARAFDLSILQGELVRNHEQALYEQYKVHDTHSVLVRSNILDRNEVILATSLETASLYADPVFILDPVNTAKEIVRLMPDLSYGDVLQKLQSSSRFVWLKRNLTPQLQNEILKIGEPGLGFKKDVRRVYPHGELLSHLIGYTNVDGAGLAGVERSFNNYLEQGKKHLQLTIDIRIQHALYREMQEAVSKFNAKGASGVVMDVNSGEVLAAVSLPSFNPHFPGKASDESLFNRFSLGVYEQGSIFKIFSTAALIENHNVDMSMKFDAREPLKRGGFLISDYHPQKRPLSVPEVFMYSSNIGSALMGEMVGTDALKDFYSDLGLFKKLSLDINESGKPIIPTPWREISTSTVSYGHGIAVSALHVISAVSSIVNGGFFVSPKFVLHDLGKERSQYNQDIRIVSPHTAHRVRQLMRLAITQGTGKSANIPGYMVGGKTGTAEKTSAGGYESNKRLSSFIGVFPMNKPQFAVLIMIDEPIGIKESYGYATGGWVAAPAVGNVITALGTIMGIPTLPSSSSDIAEPLKSYIKAKEASFETY